MSAWRDYTTAALLGTNRAAAPALPGALESAVPENPVLDREIRFLTRAGALALWRRAGYRPKPQVLEITPAPHETAALIGATSVGHLRTMLAGRHTAALAEWLEEAARRELRVPPEFLPALLELARRSSSLRPLVLDTGGHRASWLAAQVPEWSFGVRESPELWEMGTSAQRRSVLLVLRRTSPDEAREKIEAVWKAEPAETRADFLRTLQVNLAEADIPFLEAALDDRSREVTRAAVDLLARLPSSPLTARMSPRAIPLLSFKPGGLLSRALLEVTLPAEPDAAALRDGLDAKLSPAQKAVGERALWLVLILSATPLRTWAERFGQKPAALLAAAERNEFGRALATGWAWAAIRQRDAAWAGALLDSSLEPYAELMPAESLLGVLGEKERTAHLIAALRSGPWKSEDATAWHILAAHLIASAPWSLPLAREVLAALRDLASSIIPPHFRSRFESLLLHIPAALLGEAVTGWPAQRYDVAPFIELLAFRHEARAALIPAQETTVP